MSTCKSLQRRRALRALALVTAGTLLTTAQAQQRYPSKTVRIIAPFPAGGAADILARITAQRLTEQLGQTVIVENRPGAAGAIGSELVAKSAPDGYTLLVGVTASHGINPALQKLSYDAVKDFAPISLLATIPHVLVVHPSIPARTLTEFIKLARARPGMTFGSAGAGTPHHLAGEMLAQLTGTKLMHVPYKGSAPAINDLLGGHIDFMSVEYAAIAEPVKSGKVRPLAIATAKRLPGLDVPTFAEAGLPGFEVTAWYALYAPAATPADIVTLLSKEVAKALAHPDTRERLQTLHTTPMPSTPAEAAAYTRAEIARWAKVVKASGITIQK